jgi:hypothetical protein
MGLQGSQKILYFSVQSQKLCFLLNNFQEKSKISGSNNHALPNVLSSVKSRFTTPLKNLVADTSAKLAEKMGGSEGPKINKGIGSMKEKQYEKGQQWKNVTL